LRSLSFPNQTTPDIRTILITLSNVSEPLTGTLQTNQRAELMAIVRALEVAPPNHDIEIITDSQYSINCVTVWYKSWVQRNWTRSDGGKVLNRDLVEMVRCLVDLRNARGKKVTFVWVKGHNDDPGNVAADRLAVAGAQRRG
jgi:ribonuclease HI